MSAASLVEEVALRPKEHLEAIMQGKQPIFEIRTQNGEHYEIFYSGRVTGFKEAVSVFNQVPTLFPLIRSVVIQEERQRLGNGRED